MYRSCSVHSEHKGDKWIENNNTAITKLSDKARYLYSCMISSDHFILRSMLSFIVLNEHLGHTPTGWLRDRYVAELTCMLSSTLLRFVSDNGTNHGTIGFTSLYFSFIFSLDRHVYEVWAHFGSRSFREGMRARERERAEERAPKISYPSPHAVVT